MASTFLLAIPKPSWKEHPIVSLVGGSNARSTKLRKDRNRKPRECTGKLMTGTAGPHYACHFVGLPTLPGLTAAGYEEKSWDLLVASC